ncbi:MAG: shikimate kinase [Roseiflexaceae bacterium]
MRIGLIGMSGAGKTSWARKLAAAGFEHIDCDRLIAVRLGIELNRSLATLQEVGEWLGFPYETGFHIREAHYMACEIAILQEIIDTLARTEDRRHNLVVDMSGSAIYAGEAMFLKLRSLMTIVYLAVTPALHTQMLKEYMTHPRPIIWNDLFQSKPGETHAHTLTRCFSELIMFRERQYEALCDLKLDYQLHHHPDLETEDFLRLIQGQVPASLLFGLPRP